MIEKDMVARLANEYLKASECYLVEVTVRPGNLIVVEIDHDKAVGIADCAALSRFLEERLDREVEDFELEVGSSGISSPFKVVRQYVKSVGNEVEMLLQSGIKLSGKLRAADGEGATLTLERKVRPEGAKRKITVCEDQTYKYEEIKYTRNILRFR
ncbi:MAG: ribosome assembly cofactor RimP [Tannerella sp.]|nr:ribosome assembly cofactor RimP [Tannerella sp.]